MFTNLLSTLAYQLFDAYIYGYIWMCRKGNSYKQTAGCFFLHVRSEGWIFIYLSSNSSRNFVFRNASDVSYLSSQYIDTGRPADAVSAFNTAISQEREHSNAWINLGLLYEDLSQYTTALLLLCMTTVHNGPSQPGFYDFLP